MDNWHSHLANPIIWLIIILSWFAYTMIIRLLIQAKMSPKNWPILAKNWIHTLHCVLSALPLLGLLGTIMGLLGTFKILSRGNSDLEQLLSGGIADALVTTQVGLVTVIPGWLMLYALNRKLDKVTQHA